MRAFEPAHPAAEQLEIVFVELFWPFEALHQLLVLPVLPPLLTYMSSSLELGATWLEEAAAFFVLR